ncbi:hypothetical protein D088_290008 [Salmonella enterica subsp. houtenae serovar 16:z4,z32:-- str. RKS3027]|nr:hypothetical protein D088_290008 [Salmonella enterica subsp. houtenae serovar 16:z4,z32:-- str. RKS3027]
MLVVLQAVVIVPTKVMLPSSAVLTEKLLVFNVGSVMYECNPS